MPEPLTNSAKRRSGRDEASWPDGRFKYNSFKNFLDTYVFESGLHTIEDGPEIIDFHFTDNQSKNLAVFFHGAVQGKKIPGLKLPILSGQNLDLGLKVDRILFSDTTMASHQDLRLGWFSGTQEYDFSRRIDQILEHMQKIRAYDRMVLMGGSQGGFAALRASRKLPNSLALVWNPQTRIKHFSWTGHLTGYMRYCFGVESYDDLPTHIVKKRRFDLTELYRNTPDNNYVFLMQNLVDEDHLQNHARPLVEVAGGDPDALKIGVNVISDHLIVAVGDWEGGHSIPDRATLSSVAQLMFETEGPLDQLFVGQVIQQKIPASFTALNSSSVLPPSHPKKQRIDSSKLPLEREEREFLMRKLHSSSLDWYLQYGMSNVIEQASKAGFRHITAIDRDARRVSFFKEQLSSRIDDFQNVVTLLRGDPDLPEYLELPWDNAPDGHQFPDIIFVCGPRIEAVCSTITLRVSDQPSELALQVFVFNPEASKLSVDFFEAFVEVEQVKNLYHFELRKE